MRKETYTVCDREAAALLMGMKRSEITDLVFLGEEGAALVTTHDGQRTLVTPDGVVGPWTGEVPAAAPAVAQPEPVAEEEPVPEGTATEILAWVGDDAGRAQRAAKAEEVKPKPRAGLLAELTKLAGL